MNDPLFPPAIVRQAEDPELEQLAYVITSALDASEKADRTSVERQQEAGQALATVKAKLKHGEWLPWLARHKISRFKAYRLLKSHEFKCAGRTFDRDELTSETEGQQEQEIADSSENKASTLCVSCATKNRKGQPLPKKCPDCKKIKDEEDKAKATEETTANGETTEEQTDEAGRDAGDMTSQEEQQDQAARQEAIERESPFLAVAERYGKILPNVVDKMIRRLDISDDQKAILKRAVAKAVETLQLAAQWPLRPPRPPRMGKCRTCGGNVLWCETVNGKNIPLEANRGGGSWDVISDVAVKVEFTRESARDLYRCHLPCTRQRVVRDAS